MDVQLLTFTSCSLMAFNVSFNILITLVLALALSAQTILGNEVTCGSLDKNTCAFSVSSMGKRCILETSIRRNGAEKFICRVSEIVADKLKNHIETDQCVIACGLDRNTLGISSDLLLRPCFRRKLCSPQCFNACSNIVDLFSNLAAAEGLRLSKLCEAQAGDRHRELSDRMRDRHRKLSDRQTGTVKSYWIGSQLMDLVGAPALAPSDYIGAPALGPSDFIGAPSDYIGAPALAPSDFVGAPLDYVGEPALSPSDYVGAPLDYVGEPALSPSDYVRAPALSPSDFVGAPEPSEFVGAPSDYFGAPALSPSDYGAPALAPSDYVGAPALSPSDYVGAPTPSDFDEAPSDFFGAPALSPSE